MSRRKWLLSLCLPTVVLLVGCGDSPRESAEFEGWEAAQQGKPLESCPYEDHWRSIHLRKCWMNGWGRGYAQKRDKELRYSNK